MARRRDKGKRRRGRGGAFLSLLLIAGLGVLAFSSSPELRSWFSDGARKAERFEKRVRLRLGLPLRGTPDLKRFSERLVKKGLKEGDPVFIRIFKQESELEMWMRKDDRFVLFATYPICRWSGHLGPKLKEGDRQSPEGFYTVSKSQLNPNSRWHRSFNLGFPNVFDRAHGRTGSFLMVHGGCGSIGCYAMTNPVIDEVWRLVTAALNKGQPRFHVHVFPYRMSALNMALYGGGTWHEFWQDLKAGYDLFETDRQLPIVSVCEGRYQVQAADKAGGDHPISSKCSLKVTQR